MSLTSGLNPKSCKSEKWRLTWGREHNEWQWSKHGGKNKNIFVQHLVILWSCWSPQGTVGPEIRGCTESDRADNPVRASSEVLFQKLQDFQVNHGRKEKAVLGQLWFCVWLMANVPFYWEMVTISRTGWSLGPCCVLLEQGNRSSVTRCSNCPWEQPEVDWCCTEPRACTTVSFPPHDGVQHKLGMSPRDTVKWNQMWETECRHSLLLICESLLSLRKRDSLRTVLHYCVWSLVRVREGRAGEGWWGGWEGQKEENRAFCTRSVL